MVTRQMDIVSEHDVAIVNKLCKALGFEPVSTGTARRNLFGTGEDTTVTELLAEKAAEMVQRSSRDWNFDFVTECPIPGGRYLWEKVKDCDLPLWYTKQTDCKYQCDGEKENTLVVKKSSNTCLVNVSEKCNKSRLLQTSIKGYGKVGKRRTSKRLLSKRLDTKRFLRGPARVADFILTNTDSCQRS